MAEKETKWQKPRQVEEQHAEMMKKIGGKLRNLRYHKTGLSIQDFSEMVDVSRNSYGKMEKGMIYFSIYNLMKVLDAHDITIEEFFHAL